MKMKRYFAADSRTALKNLRDDQGPDAVVLSNRKVDGGVEIIAALDYEDALTNSSLGNPSAYAQQQNSDADKPQQSRQSFDEEVARPATTRHSIESDPTLATIREELKGLRNIMEAPLMQFAWGEMSRVQPLHASLLKNLMSLGLSSRLSETLVKKVSEQGLSKDSWLKTLKLLAALVPVSQDSIMEQGGIVSLVGPTGVGKTTTIAKLAAKFALRHGRRNVSLITTDSYRIAAHEQLRSYGRILGVPVQTATDSDELKNALTHIPTGDGPHLTLIDTAGISQTDIHLAEQLSTLKISGIDIKNYLVLSATGQLNCQDGVVRAFSKAGLQGCILTKTDETTSLGESLSVLIHHNLPVSYLCDGQKVPDDLHQARGNLIVKQAVELMKKTKHAPSSEELAYTFGAIAGSAHV